MKEYPKQVYRRKGKYQTYNGRWEDVNVPAGGGSVVEGIELEEYQTASDWSSELQYDILVHVLPEDATNKTVNAISYNPKIVINSITENDGVSVINITMPAKSTGYIRIWTQAGGYTTFFFVDEGTR